MFDDLYVLGRIMGLRRYKCPDFCSGWEMMKLFRNALQDVDFSKGMRLTYAIEDNGKSF